MNPESASAVPPPGSGRAAAQGCLCPVIDNEYGHGRPGPNGGRVFVIIQGCPVHDQPVGTAAVAR